MSWLARVARRHPLAFGCGFSSLKTSSADLICQTQVEGKEWKDVDWRRTSIFGLWGFAYLGGVQYYSVPYVLHIRIVAHTFSGILDTYFLYTFAFPRAFPGVVKFVEAPLRAKLCDRQGLVTLVKQVGFDQFVHHPFVVFPAFYLVKEWVEGGTVNAGLTKCRENWAQDCVVTWRVWVPVFTINFSICPLWLRVPFVAVVSFGFTMYWSFLRGAPQVEGSDAVD